MNENFEVVVVNVKHEDDGLYTATSPNLAGVCVVHRDRDLIIQDMPNIVRLWYRRNRGIEVETFVGTRRDFDDISAFPIMTTPVPIEVAAMAMGR